MTLIDPLHTALNALGLISPYKLLVDQWRGINVAAEYVMRANGLFG